MYLLRNKLTTYSALFFMAVFISCGTKTNTVENLKEQKKKIVQQQKLNITVDKFHEQLWQWKQTFNASELNKLTKTEGSFFNLYCTKIINIGNPNDPKFSFYLSEFLKDPSVTQIYQEVLKQNKDFSAIEHNLSEAFTLYQYHFPKKIIPKVKTFVSGFNYGVVATDSILGIGLDMFLGKNHSFYKLANVPDYISYFLDKKYLVTECVKGWTETEFNTNNSTTSLLADMIQAGKSLYLCDVLLPDVADTIKIKYTATQFAWIQQNQAQAWQQLIAKQTLFSTDYMEKRKFMGEAPFTNGFPRQSPPRIGQFFGWMIVRAFMENNSNYTPQMLMQEQNAQTILNKSKYKPFKKPNT